MFYPLFYVLFIVLILITGGLIGSLAYRIDHEKHSLFSGFLLGIPITIMLTVVIVALAPIKTNWHTLYPDAQIANVTIKTDNKTYHVPKDNIPKTIDNNSGSIKIANDKQTTSRDLEKIVVNGNGDRVTSIDYGKTRQTLSMFGHKLYENTETTNRLRLNYKENDLDKLFKD